VLREGAVSEHITPGSEADQINQLAIKLVDLMDEANAMGCYEVELFLKRAHAQACRALKYAMEDERARASNQN
jgi:hypothetical protein